MYRFLSVCCDAAAGAVVLLPIFVILHRRRWHDVSKAAAYLLFTLYLCGAYGAAGLPGFHNLRYRPRINLQPFAYMFSDYRSSLLNVIFFLPLGFLLPMIWKRFRPIWKATLFGLGTSAFIEILQLLTPRATDINDLMTNTLGAFVGCCAARLLQWVFPCLRPENDSRDVYWLSGLAIGVMFLFYPIFHWLLRRF